MSAETLASLLPDEQWPASEPRRSLRPVATPRRRRRPRLAYGILAVLGAGAIVAAQMVISILTTEDSYALAQLNQQQHQLTLDKQVLFDDVAGLSSPQYLAANATALGMVISESPTFLRLSDGAVVGTSAAASWDSSIDAVGRNSVSNALITDTPLVTDPEATIEGVASDEDATATVTDTPPPLTDGLPTPTTR